MRKKCPYSELFLSVFFRIWIEYGEISSDHYFLMMSLFERYNYLRGAIFFNFFFFFYIYIYIYFYEKRLSRKISINLDKTFSNSFQSFFTIIWLIAMHSHLSSNLFHSYIEQKLLLWLFSYNQHLNTMTKF